MIKEPTNDKLVLSIDSFQFSIIFLPYGQRGYFLIPRYQLSQKKPNFEVSILSLPHVGRIYTIFDLVGLPNSTLILISLATSSWLILHLCESEKQKTAFLLCLCYTAQEISVTPRRCALAFKSSDQFSKH